MRLCHIANPESIHNVRWLRYFAQRGYEVHLVPYHKPPAQKLDGIIVQDPTPRFGVRGLLSLQRILNVRRIVRRIKPDILHCHYVGHAGWWGALSGFHPLVLTAMGGGVLPEQGAYEGVLRKVMTPYAIRQADLITAGAQYTLDAVKRFAKKETRLSVIRRGVDFAVFYPYTSALDLRKNMSIGDEFKVVLSPKTLQPITTSPAIIEAIPLVLEEMPRTLFVFFNFWANQDYKRVLIAQARSLGVLGSVKFIEPVEHDKMPDLYNLADVVVSVAISDSQPSTIFEAMACGRPIVASDLPSYSHLLRDNEAALLVPPRDHRSLATALISLLRDEQLGKKIGTNALSLVRRIGDFYAEMQKLEELYQELLTQNANSGAVP